MSSIIWGIFLLLLGIQLVAQAIFGISVPFLRVGIGTFIIYAGINVILASTLNSKNPSFTTLFNTGNNSMSAKLIKENDKVTHNIVCSTSRIDLSKVKKPKQKTTFNINTTFGTSVVILNPNVPTIVNAHSAFARTSLPNETQLSLGSYTYRTHEDSEPLLEINLHTAFGSVIVETI